MGALAIWDPGGRPPRERTLNLKRPVEAMNIAAGIIAHKKNTGCAKSSQSMHHHEQSTMHLVPIFHHSIPPLRSPPACCFRSLSRGCSVILEDAEAETLQGVATRPFGGCHTRVTRSHAHPRTIAHWCTGTTEVQRAATSTEYNPCAPPPLFGDILLQYPDCLRNEGECSKWCV